MSRVSKDVETGANWRTREEPGGYLLTAQAASGIEVARARSRLLVGTVEPVVPMWRSVQRSVLGWTQKEEPQAASTVSGRVPMRGTGTERLVVVMKPGNAGGAKEACYLGSRNGQPQGGKSR